MIFLLFHLPLQVRQQILIPLLHGEADCAEVEAGGFQSQGVQGQEPRHSPAAGERAERHQRGVINGMELTNAAQPQNQFKHLWRSLCRLVFRLFKCSFSMARLWWLESRNAKWTLGLGRPPCGAREDRSLWLSDRRSWLWFTLESGWKY